MAGVTVFVSTDIALQGADLVSGGLVPNVKKGVELFLLNNVYVAGGPAVPSRGQSDVTVLLRQGLDFLSKSPHETLGVSVGCRTPEIRKAYKKHALKYHPDKNPLTTPLFQLMSSAHDRLTDPTQRQKEERTAAAKNPKPKPAPPPPTGPAPTSSANAGYSAASGRTNPHPSTANPAPQPRPTYDPKTNKWSAEAEWGKYQQAPASGPGSNADVSTKAQEAARRKQYYDDILREQFRKAESDRKAKEYAAMREAATRQSAGSSAGGTPAGSGKSVDASANPSSYYYNYANPNLKKPGQESASSAYTSRPVPPSDPSANSAYTGAGANRSYKPATGDAAKVNPQNVPLYGKIPSREGPYGGFSHPNSARRDSRDSNDPRPGRANPKPTPTPNGAPSASNRNNSAAPPTAKSSGTSSGIAGSDHPTASTNNSSFSNLRSGVKPNASRVPRPYGLRCLFVGTNAAELEWVTSKYHRNSLLAELSWRIKDSDLNASFRSTWESAGKLISSGKCRKKNLVPGAIYEFRVRAVEELAGGLLGYRSDWSDTITITLQPDKTTYSNPTAGQSSPSLKGMAAKSKSKEGAAFFADSEPVDSKTASSQSQQANAAAKPNFERFGTNAKRSEPRSNIYDQLNNNKGEASTTADGRKSTSSLPPKSSAQDAKSSAEASADGRKSTSALPPGSNIYDTTATEKVATPNRQQASNAKIPLRKEATRTDSPLHGVGQINIDNPKRNPINGLGGSGRNVWGPDSNTPDGSRNNPAKGKGTTAKSSDPTSLSSAAAAAKEKKRQESDRDKDRELEVEEDLADDNKSVEAAEVEDEISAVGVDEDSKSISSPVAAKNSKPPQPTCKTTESHGAAATPDRHLSKNPLSGGAGTASKGEFADFTIEVEEGSDSEGSEEEEDDDDFEVEYEEMYTLSAPPSKVKVAKKSSSNNLGLYAHPVRAEPVLKSTIVGYLTLGTDVLACADAGNWLKVKIHKQPTRRVNKVGEEEPEWGWSIRADKNHEYLKLNREVLPPLHVPPLSHASHNKSHTHYSTESPAAMKSGTNSKSGYFTPTTPLTDKSASSSSNPLGNRSMRALPKYPNSSPLPTSNAAPARATQDEKNVPVWMELFDENGHAYYFNEATSESQWEPPDWVEERDPASGAKYYVNLGNASADPSAPLHSTWTKPKQFARLLRT